MNINDLVAMALSQGEVEQYRDFPTKRIQRQRAGKRCDPMLRKYIQGQYVLLNWLPPEDARRAFLPADQLYSLLSEIGFVWTGEWWRPSRARSKPVSYWEYIKGQGEE